MRGEGHSLWRKKKSSTFQTKCQIRIRKVSCRNTGLRNSSLLSLAATSSHRGKDEAIARGSPSDTIRQRRDTYLRGSFKVTQKAKATKTISSLTTARRCFDKALNHLGLTLAKDLLLDTSNLANRDLLRNVFRMALQYLAERDPKGARRQKRIQANTVTRYARVAMRDLCECDVDANFLATTIEEWGEGYDREGVACGEVKRIVKKAGITPRLLKCMIQHWAPTTSRNEGTVSLGEMEDLKLVGQAAAATLFAFVLRRAEGFSGTDPKSRKFNGWIGFSRDHAEWRDKLGTVVIPNRENLGRLEREGGFLLLYPPITKTDQVGRVHGENPTPYPVGPMRKKQGRFLDVTKWIRKIELRWPLLTKGERRARPMFCSPITGEQISVARFDRWAMNAILKAKSSEEADITMAQIKEEYSLKSFRIGGLNAYDECEVPLKFRKRAGRWLRAESMENYLRLTSLKAFAKFTEMQDHEDEEDKTLSHDLPMFEEERQNRNPGTITLQPSSSVSSSQEDLEQIQQYLQRCKFQEEV